MRNKVHCLQLYFRLRGQKDLLLYLSTQIRFPIGGELVTCRWSKLTNSLGKNNLNFRLARDQVVVLETAANLGASRRQPNDFFAVSFSIFELGSITKHLTTGSPGNRVFCFPSTSMFPEAKPKVSGNKTHCFP